MGGILDGKLSARLILELSSGFEIKMCLELLKVIGFQLTWNWERGFFILGKILVCMGEIFDKFVIENMVQLN